MHGCGWCTAAVDALLPLLHCCSCWTAVVAALLWLLHCSNCWTAVVAALLWLLHCCNSCTAAIAGLLWLLHCCSCCTGEMCPDIFSNWSNCSNVATAAVQQCTNCSSAQLHQSSSPAIVQQMQCNNVQQFLQRQLYILHCCSCNTAAVATLLQLQHCCSCNTAAVATLLQLLHCSSWCSILWLQQSPTIFVLVCNSYVYFKQLTSDELCTQKHTVETCWVNNGVYTHSNAHTCLI